MYSDLCNCHVGSQMHCKINGIQVPWILWAYIRDGIVPQSKWPICLGISHAKRALMQSVHLLVSIHLLVSSGGKLSTGIWCFFKRIPGKATVEQEDLLFLEFPKPPHMELEVIWKMLRSHLCQEGGATQGDVRVRAGWSSSDLAVGRTCSWRKQGHIQSLHWSAQPVLNLRKGKIWKQSSALLWHRGLKAGSELAFSASQPKKTSRFIGVPYLQSWLRSDSLPMLSDF